MATTRAATTPDQHKSPVATQQTPQGLMSGQGQLEQGFESSPPLHRYLGNSYVQSLAGAGSVARQELAPPPIVHEVLRSPGQPLDLPTRSVMESLFGADFSQVRIHTDTRAAESARALQARAYTLGRDIVFGSGQYQPYTSKGRQLLAHELVHTVQQSGTPKAVPGSLRVSSPGDASETRGRTHCTRVTDWLVLSRQQKRASRRLPLGSVAWEEFTTRLPESSTVIRTRA